MQDPVHIGGVSKSNQRPIPDELGERHRDPHCLWKDDAQLGQTWIFQNQCNATQSRGIMHRSEPQSYRIEEIVKKKHIK